AELPDCSRAPLVQGAARDAQLGGDRLTGLVPIAGGRGVAACQQGRFGRAKDLMVACPGEQLEDLEVRIGSVGFLSALVKVVDKGVVVDVFGSAGSPVALRASSDRIEGSGSQVTDDAYLTVAGEGGSGREDGGDGCRCGGCGGCARGAGGTCGG